jgi:hypothetical protein
MSNLSPAQEWADRNHDRRTCWFPENGGCMRHNPHRPGPKSDAQRLAEKHAELAKEVAELNKENGTNYHYSAERGVYL